MKKILLLIVILIACSMTDANAQSKSYKGDSLIQIVPRYQGEASVGYVFMDGVGMGWGIQTTHGRRTSDLFYTGFGIGVDLFYIPGTYYYVVRRSINMFYNARWYLLRDKPVQLMLNLNAGLGVGTILDRPFTTLLSAGVGASFKVSPRSAINAMLSYDHKGFIVTGQNGLSLRVGFQF